MTPKRPKRGPRDGGIQISPLVQAAAKVRRNRGRWQTTYAAAAQLFRPAEHPSGARPPSGMAMDDNAFFGQNALWGARSVEASMLLEGQAFLGYPTLAIMAQRTENRAIVNILSTEMTRKWVRLVSKGKDRAKADKIAAITDRLKDLKVQRAFKQAAEGDGYFGRGHLFLQFQAGDWDDKEEIRTSIGDGRDDVSRAKCSRANPLVAIKYVEAVWTYPVDYNTTDPLRDDWFRPSTWMVMATTIHATRLLRFVMNEVPDLLKPAYSFGGLSMTQMARPYVDNWLKIRQSISDLVRQFTIRVLSTNLKATLSGKTTEGLYDRAELLTDMESNNGVVMLDQDTESINQVSAPIGGLHELQAQAEEHMSLPGRIPTVKLSGISPTGLNASSDGELEAFDDTISSMQAALFADPLRTILGFVQLSLYDEVDDDIDFEFIPLVEERPLEKAQRRLIEAQYHGAYVEMGAVDGGAVRRALAEDPDSPYPGLEEEPEAGGEDPWASLASSFAGGSSDDPWARLAGSFSSRDADDGWRKFLTFDELVGLAEFGASDDTEFEQKHKRDEGGKFSAVAKVKVEGPPAVGEMHPHAGAYGPGAQKFYASLGAKKKGPYHNLVTHMLHKVGGLTSASDLVKSYGGSPNVKAMMQHVNDVVKYLEAAGGAHGLQLVKAKGPNGEAYYGFRKWGGAKAGEEPVKAQTEQEKEWEIPTSHALPTENFKLINTFGAWKHFKDDDAELLASVNDDTGHWNLYKSKKGSGPNDGDPIASGHGGTSLAEAVKKAQAGAKSPEAQTESPDEELEESTEPPDEPDGEGETDGATGAPKAFHDFLEGNGFKFVKYNPNSNEYTYEGNKGKVFITQSGAWWASLKDEDDEDGYAPQKSGQSLADFRAKNPEFESKHKRDASGKFLAGLPEVDWEKVGGQLGSNLGAVFEDSEGKKHYAKFYKDPQQGRSEALAAKVYTAAGLDTLSPKSVVVNGMEAVASQWRDDLKSFNITSVGKLALARLYAAAVVVNDWDVLGVGEDNVKHGNSGLTQTDAGGAFRFRAQGEKKDYTPDVDSYKLDGNKKQLFGSLINNNNNNNEIFQYSVLSAIEQMEEGVSLETFSASGVDDAAELYDTFTKRLANLKAKFSGVSAGPGEKAPAPQPRKATAKKAAAAKLQKSASASMAEAASGAKALVIAGVPPGGAPDTDELAAFKSHYASASKAIDELIASGGSPTPVDLTNLNVTNLAKAYVDANEAKAKAKAAGLKESDKAAYSVMHKVVLTAFSSLQSAAAGLKEPDAAPTASKPASPGLLPPGLEAKLKGKSFVQFIAKYGEKEARTLVAMRNNGTSPEQAAELAEKAKSKGFDMTPAQAWALKSYTDNGYKEVNKAIRENRLDPGQFVFTKKLNEALNKLPKHEGTIYRKTKLGDPVLAKYQVDMVIEEHSFTSCSTSKDVWSGHVHYEIQSVTGRSVKWISSHPESEILFPTDCRFLVKSKVKDSSSGITHIVLEDVNDLY